MYNAFFSQNTTPPMLNLFRSNITDPIFPRKLISPECKKLGKQTVIFIGQKRETWKWIMKIGNSEHRITENDCHYMKSRCLDIRIARWSSEERERCLIFILEIKIVSDISSTSKEQ